MILWHAGNLDMLAGNLDKFAGNLDKLAKSERLVDLTTKQDCLVQRVDAWGALRAILAAEVIKELNGGR